MPRTTKISASFPVIDEHARPNGRTRAHRWKSSTLSEYRNRCEQIAMAEIPDLWKPMRSAAGCVALHLKEPVGSRDPDAVLAESKYVIDAIRRAGWIAGDSWQHLPSGWVSIVCVSARLHPDFERPYVNDPRVVVTLWEGEEAYGDLIAHVVELASANRQELDRIAATKRRKEPAGT